MTTNRQTRENKTTIPRQGSELQAEPVFRWPIATSMSSVFIEYQHDESLTVLTNLYVRTIVSPYLVPYVIDRHDVCDGSSTAHIDALGNRDFTVGGDGWRCGDWLNVYRDVHHGLLEIIPCGEGV